MRRQNFSCLPLLFELVRFNPYVKTLCISKPLFIHLEISFHLSEEILSAKMQPLGNFYQRVIKPQGTRIYNRNADTILTKVVQKGKDTI